MGAWLQELGKFVKALKATLVGVTMKPKDISSTFDCGDSFRATSGPKYIILPPVIDVKTSITIQGQDLLLQGVVPFQIPEVIKSEVE